MPSFSKGRFHPGLSRGPSTPKAVPSHCKFPLQGGSPRAGKSIHLSSRPGSNASVREGFPSSSRLPLPGSHRTDGDYSCPSVSAAAQHRRAGRTRSLQTVPAGHARPSGTRPPSHSGTRPAPLQRLGHPQSPTTRQGRPAGLCLTPQLCRNRVWPSLCSQSAPSQTVHRSLTKMANSSKRKEKKSKH